MKQSMRMALAAILLAAGTGLLTCPAHAQRGRSARTAASSGSTVQSTGQAGGPSGGCMNGSGSSSGTSGGTTSAGTGVSVQSAAVGAVSAQRTGANTAVVQYTGSTSNVQAIYLAVLDADGNVISQRAVTALPARASLATNSSARYYGAMVVYANGASRTSYTPVR